jgi:2-hydroxychromene-2-carboxylate isomerase
MADPHPAFFKVKAAVKTLDASKALALLAALRAQLADQQCRDDDAALVKVMVEVGLDPKAKYTLEDRDETITLKGDHA